MRLLFLSNLYPPHDLGGYEQWAREIAGLLEARGHKIHVLTSDYEVDTPLSPHAGAKVRRSLRLLTGIDYYQPVRFFTQRSRDEKHNLREVENCIRQVQPDLVLVWGMWNLSKRVAWKAEHMMPGRLAYFVSSYWPQDRDPHRAYWGKPTRRRIWAPLKAFAGKRALSQLDREGYPPPLQFEHVRCCSRYVRNRLVEAGCLPDRAGVLYGGIDPAPFLEARKTPSPDGRLRLLYFGSLTPQKGVRTAVEALRELQTLGLDERLSLTILGSGHRRYEDGLRRLVRESGLDGSVVFRPRIPREQVPVELGRHDVFLFTSVWAEPMARTVMEAMAAGLLVIGSEVGGQMEMFSNGNNALTFPARDAGALAGHIRTVLEDPELRLRLAEAGRELATGHFTLERMAAEIEAWLLTLA